MNSCPCESVSIRVIGDPFLRISPISVAWIPRPVTPSCAAEVELHTDREREFVLQFEPGRPPPDDVVGGVESPRPIWIDAILNAGRDRGHEDHLAPADPQLVDE